MSAALERSMDAMWLRQQLVMNNIANQDTPGYRAQRLDFASRLREARTNVSVHHARRNEAFANARMRVVEDTTNTIRADGNNVDIDREFIEQTRINLHWSTAIRRISGHYQTIQTAITGGR